VELNNTRVGRESEMWDFFTSNGWQVSVQEIAVQSASSSSAEPLAILDASHIAILTTTYPYIGIPRRTYHIANTLVFPNGSTWLDCATRASLPDLVFDFGVGNRFV
jgi:hypothetical protein